MTAGSPAPDSGFARGLDRTELTVTGVVLVLATGFALFALQSPVALIETEPVLVPALVVVVALGFSERFAARVRVGNSTVLITTVEVAIVVASATIPPRWCLVLVVVAETAVLAFDRTRTFLSVLSGAYVVMLTAFTVVMSGGFANLADGLVGESTAQWSGVVFGALSLALFGTTSATMVDRALAGQRSAEAMGSVISTARLLIDTVGALLGVVVVALIVLDPWSLIVLAPGVAVSAALTGRLVEVRGQLQRVSLGRQFLLALNKTAGTEPLDEALEELRELLNSTFVQLIEHDGTPVATAVAARVGDVRPGEAAAAVLLAHRNESLGKLLVGPKLGHEPFSTAEFEVIESNAGQLATWLAKWRLNDRVEYLATHDDLTGLLNRAGLDRRIAADTGGADTGRVDRGAVLLLDLDNFRQLNDTLGHDAGDELLVLMAKRIGGVLGADGPLARLGGDEFAAWVPGVSLDEMADTASQVLDALTEPCEIGGHPLHVEGSIGVASYPDHGDNVTDLIRRADVAMYMAKDGNLGVSRYDPALDPHSPERLRVLGELREALADGSLLVHFQPKFELATGRAVGVESLVRWQRADGEMVPPGRFIDAAERSGLIGPIFELVLRNSLHQLRTWARMGFDLTASVNMSARNLSDPLLTTMIERALIEYGVPAHKLTIELTERDLPANSTTASSLLAYLTSLGVQVSLDDFGTGQQSYVHLTQLPIDEIKIDQTFVKKIASNALNQGIVESLVHVARRGRLHAVAEGIEDAETLELLRGMGCEYGQGYHLCRPGPADTITAVLEQNLAPLARAS